MAGGQGALGLVVTLGGPTMFARIGIVRALNQSSARSTQAARSSEIVLPDFLWSGHIAFDRRLRFGTRLSGWGA